MANSVTGNVYHKTLEIPFVIKFNIENKKEQ